MEWLGRLPPALIVWAILAGARAVAEDPENSGTYLRNVVSELQLLNGAAEAASTQRLMAGRPDERHQLVGQMQVHASLRPEAASREKLILGLSTAEVAAMYRQTLERGVPLHHDTLLHAVQQHAPRITGFSHELLDYKPPLPPRLGSAEDSSPYAYYFYPLHSFRHELDNSYEYKTVAQQPDFKYDSSPTDSTKKETSAMNPVLLGISSFLGMALFFMVSLFFYPRFTHLMHLPFITTTRAVFQHELAHLAMLVTDAITYYDRNLKKKSKRSLPVIVQRRFQNTKRISNVNYRFNIN